MYVEIQIQRYSQRQADFPYRPACSRKYGVFTVHLWTARNHAFNGGDLMRENQNNRHYEEPTADGASVDVTEPAKSPLYFKSGVDSPLYRDRYGDSDSRMPDRVYIECIGGKGQNENSCFCCDCH